MPEEMTAAAFSGLSLAAARRALTRELRDLGAEEPEREARLLIEIATGLSPERVVLEDARALTAREAASLGEAKARRLAHEPLSRIRGEREFYGRTFRVTPAVLDPRPETETLVDLVLEEVDAGGGRQRPLRILDVGTGSGCLIVTLLAELPNATGLATDLSPAALEVARANARRHGVEGRARFAIHRSLAGVPGTFDVLVSNPPYIPSRDIAGLSPGVRDFDPHAALDGGADGLDIYREIAARADEAVPRGLIVLEVGVGQAEDVARIFRSALGETCKRLIQRTDLGGLGRGVAILTHS